MAFERITVFQAPPQIKEAVQHAREEKAVVYIVDDTVYIVVTRGEKPTGGYGVKVMDIGEYNRDQDGHSINVHVEYSNPKPGQPVTQTVTYPFAIVKTNLKDIPKDTMFRFFVDGTERLLHSTELLEQ